MCRFVPGQAVALGPLKFLYELKSDFLPGVLEIRPLVTEAGTLRERSAVFEYGTATLRTEPGLELYALSRLSASLATPIRSGEAIVDLNHILALGAVGSTAESATRFSPHAEREVAAIRSMLRSRVAPEDQLRVGVLDSGLAPEYVAQRQIRYYDYSAGGRLTEERPQVDPIGHGTRVVKLLDHMLPNSVDLSVGRLPSDPDAMTAITVAQAFGDLVAREAPDVVNLSVAPRNDTFVCRACGQRLATASFLSTLLPLMVRIGGRSENGTITVMASGNTGQVSNSRWLSDGVSTLVFAVAENRRGERTRYSSAPEGPRADLHSAAAFGGDDPDDADSQGVFADGSHGTSFAAPFVSAAALITPRGQNPNEPNATIGALAREVIANARAGKFGPAPSGAKAG